MPWLLSFLILTPQLCDFYGHLILALYSLSLKYKSQTMIVLPFS